MNPGPPGRLILFDVDATLITTSRAGIRALEMAGRELLGGGFTVEGTDFAGRLDPLIIADLLRANSHLGAPPGADAAAALRDGYARCLERVLADPATRCGPLPGVVELLSALRARAAAGVTLGLLTGNFPETGRRKLRACGLDPDAFHLHVWADDARGSAHAPPSRDELAHVALARWARSLSLPGPWADPPSLARRAVVVGDTPHDVSCARAAGCRCLAVATGVYSEEALGRAGAHWVVPTLADTGRVLEMLLSDPWPA